MLRDAATPSDSAYPPPSPASIQTDGKLVCLGAPPVPPAMPLFEMLFRRLTVGGSLIGGIKETQEMLEFCAEKGVLLPYETISADYINTAYERCGMGAMGVVRVWHVRGMGWSSTGSVCVRNGAVRKVRKAKGTRAIWVRNCFPCAATSPFCMLSDVPFVSSLSCRPCACTHPAQDPQERRALQVRHQHPGHTRAVVMHRMQ